MTAPAPVDLIVQSGTVIDLQWEGPADVWVAGGRIAALVEHGTVPPAQADGVVRVDATGRVVLPGGG